jgi:hypothetical protein
LLKLDNCISDYAWSSILKTSMLTHTGGSLKIRENLHTFHTQHT